MLSAAYRDLTGGELRRRWPPGLSTLTGGEVRNCSGTDVLLAGVMENSPVTSSSEERELRDVRLVSYSSRSSLELAFT